MIPEDAAIDADVRCRSSSASNPTEAAANGTDAHIERAFRQLEGAVRYIRSGSGSAGRPTRAFGHLDRSVGRIIVERINLHIVIDQVSERGLDEPLFVAYREKR